MREEEREKTGSKVMEYRFVFVDSFLFKKQEYQMYVLKLKPLLAATQAEIQIEDLPFFCSGISLQLNEISHPTYI